MSEWPEVIELKGYTPKPGDVLFITLKSQIGDAAIERFHFIFKELVPDVKVVLLFDGATVEVPT